MPRQRTDATSGSQQSLRLAPRTWGGAREGAGRPPRRDPGNPHRARPQFAARFPLHVTLRMKERVYNLRSRRSWKVIERAFLDGGADRYGTRIVQFSVQGNHLHLIVEAPGRVALSRAMKGLGVRIAKGMNRMMGRRGQVLGERYHARILRTPTEVKNALHYVRHNHRHHEAQRGHSVAAAFVDPYSSAGMRDRVRLPAAKTWLLSVGWRRALGRARERPLRGRR